MTQSVSDLLSTTEFDSTTLTYSFDTSSALWDGDV